MWSVDAGGSPATPLDESVPEVVKLYILLPCEAMVYSYKFQEVEIAHIETRKVKCETWVGENEVKYGPLLCMYVEMQRQFIYSHIKSLEKAYELICDDAGHRKNPQYNIDF